MDAELVWASGLFEGEGCFSTRRGRHATAILSGSDEDTVRRFCRAVGVGKVYGPRLRPPNKPIWVWCTAKCEHVQAVVAMLWFGLGARRRARAKEVLATMTWRKRAVKEKIT